MTSSPPPPHGGGAGVVRATNSAATDRTSGSGSGNSRRRGRRSSNDGKAEADQKQQLQQQPLHSTVVPTDELIVNNPAMEVSTPPSTPDGSKKKRKQKRERSNKKSKKAAGGASSGSSSPTTTTTVTTTTIASPKPTTATTTKHTPRGRSARRKISIKDVEEKLSQLKDTAQAPVFRQQSSGSGSSSSGSTSRIPVVRADMQEEFETDTQETKLFYKGVLQQAEHLNSALNNQQIVLFDRQSNILQLRMSIVRALMKFEAETKMIQDEYSRLTESAESSEVFDCDDLMHPEDRFSAAAPRKVPERSSSASCATPKDKPNRRRRRASQSLHASWPRSTNNERGGFYSQGRISLEIHTIVEERPEEISKEFSGDEDTIPNKIYELTRRGGENGADGDCDNNSSLKRNVQQPIRTPSDSLPQSVPEVTMTKSTARQPLPPPPLPPPPPPLSTSSPSSTSSSSPPPPPPLSAGQASPQSMFVVSPKVARRPPKRHRRTKERRQQRETARS